MDMESYLQKKIWQFVIVGDCSPGHWCLSGVDRPYPGLNNQSVPFNNSCYDDRMVGTGGVCPTGYYCPGGIASYLPVPCANGTYADVEGLDTCKQCPEGEGKVFASVAGWRGWLSACQC